MYMCDIPGLFQRGDNYEIAKIHWWNLKIFFSRTTGPISTKLGTMHPWVKGFQVCSNEEPHPFPRGDNYQIAKIQMKLKKHFFSRTTLIVCCHKFFTFLSSFIQPVGQWKSLNMRFSFDQMNILTLLYWERQ